MSGKKNLNSLGIPWSDSDDEEGIEGSTPQPSQQNQQPFQPPTVFTSQEETQGSKDSDSDSDNEEEREEETQWSEDSDSDSDNEEENEEDMVFIPGKIYNDIKKMKKDIKGMERGIWCAIGAMEEMQEKVLERLNVWTKKTDENLEIIKKDLQKQQNSRTENATGRKRSKEKQKLDPLCRENFRKMYKTLEKKENFRGFNLKGSFDSAENEEVFKKVKEKMSGNNGSRKWTDEQIKVVGRRYFLSLYETDKKKSDNKYDEHKTNSRRQNRKKQKLKRRTEALDKINWVIHQKGKAAEVLTEEYMSSEVSDDEGCVKEKKLYIRTVTWESEELKTIKNKLDEEYASRQTFRSRRREFQRDRRPKDVSSRPKPNNGPSWAFRKDDGQ